MKWLQSIPQQLYMAKITNDTLVYFPQFLSKNKSKARWMQLGGLLKTSIFSIQNQDFPPQLLFTSIGEKIQAAL